MLEIYTDGGCEANGKKGAIGAWAFTSSDGAEHSGKVVDTTSNRMELQAIIEALRYRIGSVVIYSDSNICVNCGMGKWKRKANLDLWEQFKKVFNPYTDKLVWVKGHNGLAGNERADYLVRKAMK